MTEYGRGSAPATTFHEVQLRCSKCFTPIEKKPKAKTPKYCPPCRHQIQQSYKDNVRQSRR